MQDTYYPDMAYARVTAPHLKSEDGGGRVHLRFVPEPDWANQTSMHPDCNPRGNPRGRAELVVTDDPITCLRCLDSLGQYQRSAEHYTATSVRASAARGLRDLSAKIDDDRAHMLAYTRLVNGTPEVGEDALALAEQLRLASAVLTMSARQIEPEPEVGADPDDNVS
jgi:hypothetical protein